MLLKDNSKLSLVHLDEIDSTNLYAINHLEILHDKTVIVADTQNSGKGRLNRSWISNNKKNLYFSLVLKESLSKLHKVSDISNLTQVMALSIAESLRGFGIDAKIKWPNDILINNKKIAGILSQAQFEKGNPNSIVIGVGINLFLDEKDIKLIDKPATSIFSEYGIYIDKFDLLNHLLERFFELFEQFLYSGFNALYNQFLNFFETINKVVKVTLPTEEFEATATGLDIEGRLLVERLNGKLETLTIGDIL